MFATVHNSRGAAVILARFDGTAPHLQAMAYVRNLARQGRDVAGLVVTWFAVSQYLAARNVTLYQPQGAKTF